MESSEIDTFDFQPFGEGLSHRRQEAARKDDSLWIEQRCNGVNSRLKGRCSLFQPVFHSRVAAAQRSFNVLIARGMPPFLAQKIHHALDSGPGKRRRFGDKVCNLAGIADMTAYKLPLLNEPAADTFGHQDQEEALQLLAYAIDSLADRGGASIVFDKDLHRNRHKEGRREIDCAPPRNVISRHDAAGSFFDEETRNRNADPECKCVCRDCSNRSLQHVCCFHDRGLRLRKRPPPFQINEAFAAEL